MPRTLPQLATKSIHFDYWAPHRPNYSKYENGKSIPEPETLAKFVRYWSGKGKPGPDFTPPKPAVDPVVAAMDRQTAVIQALVDELRRERSERQERIAELEAMVDGLLERSPAAPNSAGAAAHRVPRRTKE